MAEARALLLNPADTSRGYVVWSHGDVVPFGGQPPSGAELDYTDRVIGAQMLDWDDPAGAVFYSDGKVQPFGDCDWSEPATLDAWPIVRAIHCNPSGANQGYRMLADGTIQKWGAGTPNPTWEPGLSGTNRVRAWEFDWASLQSVVLRENGHVQAYSGVTGYTAEIRPGRDVYRALAVREWDSLPAFWVADMEGRVFRGNGAEVGWREVEWLGRDAVRDLAVVSDGLEGRPLTLALLVSWGGVRTWTVSSPPTVTVEAPDGEVTDTTRPEVRWTYEDPNGDAQANYHAAIFWEADTLEVGFDPFTAPAVWRHRGSDPTVMALVPDVDLDNGDYAAYVRASDSSGLVSDWDHSLFAVDVAPPGVPWLTVTPAGGWSVTIEVADATGAETIEIESTVDDPDATHRTWEPVRDVPAPVDGDLLAVDWEAPLNRTVWYRARSRTGTLASKWSHEHAAVLPEDARWILSDPTTPGTAVAVAVVPDLEWTEPIPAGVQRPPGRREAIVVRHAGRQSAEATLTVRTLDRAAHNQLGDLLDGRRPLLIRSPYGQHWWCSIHGDISTRMLDAIAPVDGETTVMRHAHETTVQLVETERP